MKNIKFNILQKSVLVALIVLVGFSCERELSADAVDATYPKTGAIFIEDVIGMGTNFYFPYNGSKTTAWTVDRTQGYNSSACMRFDVPNANDTDGNYAGAIFRTEGAGRDLSGYDALTFYIKANRGVSIDEFGFGEDFLGNKFMATITNVSVGTNWTKVIIPIPDASKLVKERGMLRYAAGTQATGGSGYVFWIDDLKFEKLGTIRLLTPQILNGNNTTISSFTGSSQVINQLGALYNLGNGQNISQTVAPSYFNFISSNESVATVNKDGLVNVIGQSGTAVITAKIGNVLAQGSLTILSNGSFPQPITPTNPASNVRSVFSNSYSNVVTPNFNPNFGGSTTITTLESVGGNDIVRYLNNNFTGIMFVETPINGSAMTFMHVDVYVQSATSVEFQIRDIGANQIIETNVNNGNPTGDDRDFRFTANGLTPGWNSLNIPLAGGIATQKNNLGAIILVGGSSFILDNIYFFF